MTRLLTIYVLLFLCFWIGMDHFHIQNRITLIEVFGGLGITIVASLFIRQIQRYYHAINVLNFTNLSTILLCAGLGSTIIFVAERPALSNDQISNTLILEVFLIRTLIYALMLTIALLLFWIERQKHEEERIKKYIIKKQKELSEFEVRNLEQQWQPHFLFNSLNSINALVQVNPEKSQEMIHLLSDYMRNSVRLDQQEMTSLKEEINHLKRYTDIEKIRFGKRLSVEYHIDQDLINNQLPRMILQPLMENAIKYSLYDRLDEVKITLQANSTNGSLEIVIENPFDQETAEASRGTGFGLKSVEKKLYLLYHRNDLMKTEKKDNLFITTIQFPQ